MYTFPMDRFFLLMLYFYFILKVLDHMSFTNLNSTDLSH